MLRLISTAGPIPIPARSGSLLNLRISHLAAGDTATIRKVFDGLSARSRQLRFHAGRSTLSAELQQQLAEVWPGSHVAHVARLTNRPIGIARWIRFADNPQTAELAVEVIDVAQHHGVGSALVAVAAESAQAAGVEYLHAYISADNLRLRSRAFSFGAAVDRADPELFRLSAATLQGFLGRPRDTPMPSR
jgi:L-amino acid N-acyltransferase YncA